MQFAERALNPENKRAEFAFLWDFITSSESDKAEVELREVRVSEFLPAFGLKVAKQLGEPDLIARWRARAEASETSGTEVMS